MWMLRLALLLVAAQTCSGGLPECSSQRFQCHYTVSPDFGDAVAMMFDGKRPDIWEHPGRLSAVCNEENWRRKETWCDVNCPLKFEITYPEQHKMIACAVDSAFSPFVPTAHLDMKHPYNGKEFDLVVHGSPGNRDRMGCDPKSFEGKNYTGKIVVMERGGCYFSTKFQNLAPTGAVMGVMVNVAVHNIMDFVVFPMGGTSAGFENLPTMMIATHYRERVVNAYDSGTPLRGKITLGCDSAGAVDPEWVGDGCPYFMLTKDICTRMKDDEHRLCVRCPAEIEIPGQGTACLYGNELKPRRAKNNFFAAFSLPMKESVVYLNLSNGTGCTVEEYLPHKGRIVAVSLPRFCLAYTAVLRANEAGVKGLIFVPPAFDYFPTFVEGTSYGITIPVATMAPWNSTLFTDHMKTQTPFPWGFESPGLVFREGLMPPQSGVVVTPPPTQAPIALVREEDKEAVEGSPAVVVSCVVMAIVFGVIAVRKAKSKKLESFRNKESGRTVPLGVASTGLSLSLLVMITAIAFVLAYEGGQQAIDTVSNSGLRAVEQTHQVSVQNTADLSAKLLDTITGSTVQMMSEMLNKGFELVRYFRYIYYLNDGSWEAFDSKFSTMVQISKPSRWMGKVLTTQGFYADQQHKTDDRPDSVRKDGQPHVNVTGNGHLYGWLQIDYNDNTWQPTVLAYNPRGWYDPFKMIGAYHGDPLGSVRDLPDLSQEWYISEYNMPVSSVLYGLNHVPLTVIMPLNNAHKVFTGAAVAELDVSTLNNILLEEQTGDMIENATIFIMDGQKELLVSTNRGRPYKMFDLVPTGSSYALAHKLYTIADVKWPEINAAANFIETHYGSLANHKISKGRGEFDQRDYYKGHSSLLMHFPFEGSLLDSSGNNWKAAAEGTLCEPQCYRGGRTGQARAFDGTGVVHLYSNLTLDAPFVAATRLGVGPWRSSMPVYNQSGILPDGSEAVYWEGRPVLREPFIFEDVTLSVWLMHDDKVDMSPGATSGQIFSDTEGGDAALRWYANGMLFVSRIDYGCRTNAVRTLRAGVWVHLAAVVNWREGYCAVYVDGELYHKTTISYYLRINRGSGVYYIGSHYKGIMDDFRVHNKSLAAEEVKSVFESGDVGLPPSRRWYLGFGREDDENKRTYFLVVTMLPVEDVQRNVEANNKVTVRNLQVEEENMQRDLDQITSESILILLMVVSLCTLVFLLFNEMITAPFTSFAQRMLDVAVMRVEAIQETKYIIRELSAMDRAMVLMARNLQEYKSFMPRSILNEEEEPDTEMHENSKTSSFEGSKKSTSDSFCTDSTGRIVSGAARIMTVGLTPKRVTLVVSNVVGFHGMMRGMAEGEFTDIHGSILRILVSAASGHGVPGVFSGDRLLVSFNTSRPAAGHRLFGCQYIKNVQDQIEEQKRGVKMTFSCVAGEAKVGVMGSEVMKQYSIIGSLVTWAYTLERHCRKMGQPNMLDESVIEAAANEYMFYHCDFVTFPKHKEGIAVVSTLVNAIDVSTDEWMYQLEEALKKNPYAMWNTMMRSLGVAAQEAEEQLEDIPDGLVPEPVFQRAVQQIREKRVAATPL